MPVTPPRTTRRAPRSPLLAALATATLACAPQRTPLEGAVEVALPVRTEVGDPAVVSAWVRATGTTSDGSSVDRWVEATGARGALAASVVLPIGAYELSARGFGARPADPASAAPDFETPARPTIAITPGAARVALLVLDRDRGAPQPGNHAPHVQGLVASGGTLDSSDPAAAVDLVAIASDPDGGDVPAVSWTSRYDPPPVPAGALRPRVRAVSSGPSASGTMTFAPPSGYEGTATLTATATDPQLATSSATVQVAIAPKKPSQATIVVTAVVNVFPEITSISATPGAQLLPGGTTTFTVTASDANLDPLAYGWNDGGCGGTFASPAAATTAWTAPATAAPLSCTIQVLVRDLGAPGAPTQPKGGSNAAFVVASVRPDASGFGPEFVFATQSPAPPLLPGARAWFQVAAVEGGTPLPLPAYAWGDGAGGTFTPVVAGDASYVTWTAPPCGTATAPLDLTVTATATGTWGSTTFPFPVRVSCP